MLTAHAPILETRTLHWPDEAACAAFAASLAQRPALADAYIELRGPLGAGKTTFVRHLLRALGVAGRIKSPTYAVLEPYALPGLAISTSTSTASTTRANGSTPASARSSRPRASSSPSGRRRPPACCPLPDLRLSIEPIDGDLRQVRAEAGTATRRGVVAVTAPARRRALRAMGRVVLLLAAPRLARGANSAAIVAVRVWPAQDYTRITDRVRRPLGGHAPDRRRAPSAGRRHRRPGTAVPRCANSSARCGPTIPTSPACAWVSSSRGWCGWCSTSSRRCGPSSSRWNRSRPTSTGWCSISTRCRRSTRCWR